MKYLIIFFIILLFLISCESSDESISNEKNYQAQNPTTDKIQESQDTRNQLSKQEQDVFLKTRIPTSDLAKVILIVIVVIFMLFLIYAFIRIFLQKN